MGTKGTQGTRLRRAVRVEQAFDGGSRYPQPSEHAPYRQLPFSGQAPNVTRREAEEAGSFNRVDHSLAALGRHSLPLPLPRILDQAVSRHQATKALRTKTRGGGIWHQGSAPCTLSMIRWQGGAGGAHLLPLTQP